MKEDSLSISGTSDKKNYEASFELFESVIVEESKWNTKGRYIILNIVKKDQDRDEYWPRITKEKVKNPHIKVDWSMWVDEDEEGAESQDTGAWDPSAMQGFDMGGMGGMGGMEEDSDDDSEEEAAGEVKDPEADKDAKADLDDLDEDEEVDPTKTTEEKKDESA